MRPPEDSFYVERAGRFMPTELTRGPWSGDHQHGGPPAALMARALERAGLGRELMQVARLSVEFVRPVPIAPLELTVQVSRPGRKVELTTSSLSSEGREVARATALKIRRKHVDLPEIDAGAEDFAPPAGLADYVFPFFSGPIGYHTAIDLRFARGALGKGAAAAWFRTRYPLVLGETPTPLERVMLAADSGNGISVVLDFERWLFINPDLTVYLFREPVGEWVLLDSRTLPAATGVGLTDTRIYDERGPIGRGCQSLLIDDQREPG
jgi:hypothetical protein